MHTEARHFLAYCCTVFGSVFYNGKVLDVGSGDINGNNRIYFDADRTEYVGCDVMPGPNVNICSPCHELPFSNETFDVIISSECFEHDMHYEESFPAIYRMLKNSGIFIFTCASTGRAEHGTRKSSISASLSTSLNPDSGWPDYYKNLTEQDVVSALMKGTGKTMQEMFGYYAFHYNKRSFDLYFVGIKPPLNYALSYVIPYEEKARMNENRKKIAVNGAAQKTAAQKTAKKAAAQKAAAQKAAAKKAAAQKAAAQKVAAQKAAAQKAVKENEKVRATSKAKEKEDTKQKNIRRGRKGRK